MTRLFSITTEADYKHKIFIAGTHDRFFEEHPDRVRQLIPKGVTYLEESGVELEGVSKRDGGTAWPRRFTQRLV